MTALEKLEYIDEELVERAAQTKKKNTAVKKWLLAAACVCLAAVGGLAVFCYGRAPGVSDSAGEGAISSGSIQGGAVAGEGDHTTAPVKHWSEFMRAEEYFPVGESSQSSSSEESMVCPYDETRSFSRMREELEREGAIPLMDDHPLFSCEGMYYSDGSIYAVRMQWSRRGSMEEYSDLTLTAYPEGSETVIADDTESVRLDGNGAQDHTAVTVRDGIEITARGKTLSYSSHGVLYNIGGSWNDSCEDVVWVLDWVWENPVELERYSIDRGDLITLLQMDAPPEQTERCTPDLAALGYNWESGTAVLRNGEFLSFECCCSRPSEDGGEYWLWWSVDSEPDVYDRQEARLPMEELTREYVEQALGGEQHVRFTWGGLCVTAWFGSNVPAAEAWRVINAVL